MSALTAFSGLPLSAIVVVAALLGLIFGSFVTAISYRLPRGLNITTDRSCCQACGHVLTPADLVPVLSWLRRGGACAHCGAKVSARYPAIELVSMILFATAAIAVRDPIRLMTLLVMTPALLAIAVIDLEQGDIPTALVGFLVLPAFVWCWRSGGSLPIGLGIAALVIILAVAAHRGIPRESRLGGIFVIGGGDVKLLAVAAVALSVPSYFVFLIGAGVFGLLFGIYWRKRTGAASFPFGPALSFALWSAMALPLPFPLTM